MEKAKFVPPCIDVAGRKISWKTEGGSRLYGTVTGAYYEHYKPENPEYPTQRFLRKRVTVFLNDSRVMDIPAEQEDIKRMGIIGE